MLRLTRTHAISTPKSCQDRKVAAIRDAWNRREIRVTLVLGVELVAMTRWGELVQKALYMGVGLASYTTEKASTSLAELREQAQTLTEELVQRGELTAKEAQQMVETVLQEAQAGQTAATSDQAGQTAQSREPRPIEIDLDDDENSSAPADATQVNSLRQQVADLQAELDRLKQ